MTARLTILLGAGGVGKTTLAVALGVAHARMGARTAVLGVDPARRLRSALALADIPEQGLALPVPYGALAVAVLDPGASLRRWVAEACPDPDARARLLVNPYFVALADRLAGATDAIGCARAAEWAEREPALDELVLDTAPGVSAVELLAKPEKLLAFFDGKLMRWLVRLARVGRGGRLLGGIADAAGANVLRDLGDLLGALEAAVATLHARLDHARRWIAAPSTAILIACGVRASTVDTTHELVAAVRALGLAPTAIVLDRVLPAELAAWFPRPDGAEASAFARYVANRVRTQERVRARFAAEHRRVLLAPELTGLETTSRLDALAALGEPLRAALASHPD